MHSFAAIEEHLSRVTWTKDNWRMLWDAISYPRQTLISGKGDCDDASVLALNIGRDGVIGDDGIVWEPVGMLSVVGVGWGHNVAVFGTPQKTCIHIGDEGECVNGVTAQLCHVSNWFGGRPLGNCGSLIEIATDVASRMRSDAVCLSLTNERLSRCIFYRWLGSHNKECKDISKCDEIGATNGREKSSRS